MSDEHDDDGPEIHVHVIGGGLNDLVSGLAKMLHEATEGMAFVLVVGPNGQGGACGLQIRPEQTPAMVMRLRQAADAFEHEYLARSN